MGQEDQRGQAAFELRVLAQAAGRIRSFIDQHRLEPAMFQVLPDDPAKGPTSSRTRAIDIHAEQFAAAQFGAEAGLGPLLYQGEDSPARSTAPTGDCRIVVGDPLDGTTLLAQGQSHWVSAFALVEPAPRAELVMATVADSAGRLWAAHRDLDGISVTAGDEPIQLKLSPQYTLSGATLSFDGTTPAKIRRLQQWLGPRFDEIGRILAIGGSPAIILLLQGKLDCVLGNSRWYDFAQAAFIAEKAGAYARLFSGAPLPYNLAHFDPAQRYQWIVAANSALGEDLRQALTAPS